VSIIRKIEWLPEAIPDLAHVREFIQVHNSDAASRAANRIRDAVKKLPDYSQIGRPVLDIASPLFRDIFITFGQSGYWLRYTIINDAIIIVRIWHGRENTETPK